jgi:hypothetical protein
MALNQAQLIAVPGGPDVIGAVSQGANVTITNGVVSTPVSAVTQLTAGTNITLTPSSGVGDVTVSLTVVPAGTNFPAGTVMPFKQATAPLNWTKLTTTDDGTLRIVSGAGGGTGGSVNYTSAFTSWTPSVSANFSYSGSTNTDNTNLTPTGIADIAGGRGIVGDTTLNLAQFGAHSHLINQANRDNAGGQHSLTSGGNYSLQTTRNTDGFGGNQGHNHSFNGATLDFAGNQSSHSHSLNYSGSNNFGVTMNAINLGVVYVDLILCSRN